MLRSNGIRLRAQLSLVVADLAKLRYVKKAKQLGLGRHDMSRKTLQDDRNTFSTLLGRVMDARHTAVVAWLLRLKRAFGARSLLLLVDFQPATQQLSAACLSSLMQAEVCHIVCALARVSPARTNVSAWRTQHNSPSASNKASHAFCRNSISASSLPADN